MIYYAIITPEQYEANIPDFVKAYMEYPESYPLKDCIFGTPQQITNGNWVVDCRFRTYYNYKCNESDLNVIGISNNCTKRYLTEQEVEQWRQWVGSDNVITDIENLEYEQQP